MIFRTLHFLFLYFVFNFFCQAFYTPQLTSPDHLSQLYFVYFKDKPSDKHFDATTYFHPKALQRRQKHRLPQFDTKDIPLNPIYVSTVARIADTLRYELRWFNAVSVRCSEVQISQISQLPFVREIEKFRTNAYNHHLANTSYSFESDPKLDTLLSLTRNLMQLDSLEAHHLTGRGIRVAIFDAGFKEANTHPALEHVRTQNNIIATRNFYEGTDNVYNHSWHGTQVMSCVAGIRENRQLGCGKDVSFLLARTEHEKKEFPIEEDHWIAAAEWADKLGADIINSSITFTRLRYTYQNMDGKTAPVSRAASIAGQKGILVVCSMGNEGDGDWKYMGAPADAVDVLSVGGSMPMLPMYIKFASIGPNAKGEQKPDISAPAYVVTSGKKGKFTIRAGTSFASPLIAGLAACLMQKYPDETGLQISERIKRLGHYYPYYDYHLGYGVPQVAYLFQDSIPNVMPTISLEHRADTIFIHFDQDIMIEDSISHPNGRVLYYHLADSTGKLHASQFELVPNKAKQYYFLRRKESEGILRIWFEGYLLEVILERMD